MAHPTFQTVLTADEEREGPSGSVGEAAVVTDFTSYRCRGASFLPGAAPAEPIEGREQSSDASRRDR